MKYWLKTPCVFCTKPLMNTTSTDAHCGCHGWRMHTDCLKQIARIRNEITIKNLRKDFYYIRIWTKEKGEVLVYA